MTAGVVRCVPRFPRRPRSERGAATVPKHRLVTSRALFESNRNRTEQANRRNFSVILRPSQTSVFVPAAFLEPDTEYKLEVIAQEESGNRTIAETGTFTTDSP